MLIVPCTGLLKMNKLVVHNNVMLQFQLYFLTHSY